MTQGIKGTKSTTKLSITIDTDTLTIFKMFCQTNGMKISSRIQKLIKKDIEENR